MLFPHFRLSLSQESNTVPPGNGFGGRSLIGFSDSRFYVNATSGGVVMVVDNGRVSDPDGNPSPRVELLYRKNFNPSDTDYHSLNFTAALMNWLPNVMNGRAPFTQIGQVG